MFLVEWERKHAGPSLIEHLPRTIYFEATDCNILFMVSRLGDYLELVKSILELLTV